MSRKRRKAKEVLIGNVRIGGSQPVVVQSMTKTDTRDVARTVRQIKRLETAGCEIVRMAVRDMPAAEAIGKIKKKIENIPLVADIHFHYQLALKAIVQGIDGIRLNPGNINKREEIKKIVKQAKRRHIPIRVGVNAGSLFPTAEPVKRVLPNRRHTSTLTPKDTLASIESKQTPLPERVKLPATFGAIPTEPPLPKLKTSRHPLSNRQLTTADMMVNSARKFIRVLEDLDFYDIIVSLKASSIVATVEAYRRMAELCSYPFHLGITATAPEQGGNIRSAIALGTLLLEGIGDTLRVSLTAPPEEEVKAGREILSSLGLRSFGPKVVSCPTCGRCQVNLIRIVQQVSRRLCDIRYTGDDIQPLKVAIMGCVVNGPGEAKDADVGIACGKESGVLFRRGQKVKRVKEEDIVKVLLEEIECLEKPD